MDLSPAAIDILWVNLILHAFSRRMVSTRQLLNRLTRLAF